MNAKKIISEGLRKALKVVAGEELEFEIQSATRSENGDYFTNVALRLGAKLSTKPLDIAYEIKVEFEKLGLPEVEKVDIAPPGFVNFFLSEEYLSQTLIDIEKKGDLFGSSDFLKNQKTMVEFTDPNPFKEFHIGHLYSNIVGESIARLYESQGAEVVRVCYQGDVGLHVAKAIYGMKLLAKEMPDKKSPLSARAQFMGRAYALGAKTYDDEGSAKKEIEDLNQKIYAVIAGSHKEDKSVQKLYKTGRKWSLEYFDSLYKKLGTKFAHFYFESEVGKAGVALVREFLNKNVFEESDGAVIFPGEKLGLHNRVFINSAGLPTYEAKDLALAGAKYQDFPYDTSIIITAQEQSDYFKVILKALKQINPELAKKTIHVAHGMVRLPGGKMSSRTGDVITGEWLIDEAVSRVSQEYPDMDSVTAEKVGLAAIKYAFLRNSIGRDIEFSFDESISLEGNSGPYLLYAYVRTQSVLKKSQKLSIKNQISIADKKLNSEELAVLRALVRFQDVISEAQLKMSPNLLSSYLFEISQKFNLFYQKHKIAGNKFRLELTEAVGQTLKNGLKTLGIETVEKM